MGRIAICSRPGDSDTDSHQHTSAYCNTVGHPLGDAGRPFAHPQPAHCYSYFYIDCDAHNHDNRYVNVYSVSHAVPAANVNFHALGDTHCNLYSIDHANSYVHTNNDDHIDSNDHTIGDIHVCSPQRDSISDKHNGAITRIHLTTSHA